MVMCTDCARSSLSRFGREHPGRRHCRGPHPWRHPGPRPRPHLVPSPGRPERASTASPGHGWLHRRRPAPAVHRMTSTSSGMHAHPYMCSCGALRPRKGADHATRLGEGMAVPVNRSCRPVATMSPPTYQRDRGERFPSGFGVVGGRCAHAFPSDGVLRQPPDSAQGWRF
jgi:hypothetical protein